MSWQEFLKPDLKKIIVSLPFLIYFLICKEGIPHTIGCMEFGFPTFSNPYAVLRIIFAIITSYLIACLIFRIYKMHKLVASDKFKTEKK